MCVSNRLGCSTRRLFNILRGNHAAECHDVLSSRPWKVEPDSVRRSALTDKAGPFMISNFLVKMVMAEG